MVEAADLAISSRPNVDRFYRAFEDKFRGSRDLIRSRLEIYRNFLEPLLAAYPNASSIDLGCGRGEFIEMQRDMGIDAMGVDLDEGMLAACQELKLNVRHADALTYLQQQLDNSQIAVSAIHIVEHLDFQELRALVEEAHRVLVPGGVLIMETPNPENFAVAAWRFRLDPTHQHPIPSELLSFLADFYGFARTTILRLQHRDDLSKETTLSDVLFEVSPDYAVVAQKTPEDTLLKGMDEAFAVNIGLTAPSLLGGFEARLRRDHDAMEENAKAIDGVIVSIAELKIVLENSVTALHEKFEERLSGLHNSLETSLHNATAIAQRAAKDAENSLVAIRMVEDMLKSTSWRITAPMRAIKRFMMRFTV